MKLTVLGNNGPYPGPGGACSGYLLSTEKTNILIECGTGTLARLSSILDWKKLDAVVLSHLHFDHMSDMLPMQYALQFHPRTAPLPVFAPLTPAPVRALLEIPAYDLHAMDNITIGDIELSFMPVRHPVESFAIRAACGERVFAYTGDTNIVPTLADFVRGADLLLADAGLAQADWTEKAPHLSACECAALAQSAGVKKLLLTHLNPRYTPNELEAEARTLRPDAEFARISACYDI